MKKFSSVLAIVAALAIMFIGIGAAMAADVELNSKISSVKIALDKNGNEYVRFIIAEKKDLNGFAYETEAAVMVFGGAVATAKTMKAGDTLSAICNQGEYKGRTSYTVLAFKPKLANK